MDFIVGTAYAPVAAGSPGPFDKNTPSGFSSKIDFAEVLDGKTITSQPTDARQRRILCLAP